MIYLAFYIYTLIILEYMQQKYRSAMKNSYVEEKVVLEEALQKVSRRALRVSPIHRAIGALTFQINGHLNSGSAVLISKDLILTAAHNIYSLSGLHSNFKFYLAPHGVTQVEKYISIKDWRYPKEFPDALLSSEKSKYDYAVMRLAAPIEYESYGELAVTCPECRIEEEGQLKLSIFGYPSLPAEKNKIEFYQCGLEKQKRVKPINYDSGVIDYQISTLPGQSGCPVVNEGSIIAVHIGQRQNEPFNIGRLITFDLLQNLKCWVGELSAQQFVVNCNTLCQHYRQYRESLKQAPPIQIKEQDFYDIFEKLSSIPLAEKQKATSLTLKSKCEITKMYRH